MSYSRSNDSSVVNPSEEDIYDDLNDNVAMTVLGETRTLAGLERNEWIFLIISVSCILATVGLTIQRLSNSADLPKDSADFLFALLLLINAGFCLFYAVHGVLREREYELYCLIVAILIVSVYTVVDFVSTLPKSTRIKEARITLIGLFVPFIIGFAWVVGKGFGYLEFKTVGAGAEVQAMYRAAVRFSGLLKLDFQLVVILLVLTIENCSDISYYSKCSLAAGIPSQLLTALIGWIAMRTEQLALVWLFLPLCLAEPIFIGVRLSQFAERWSHFSSTMAKKLTYSFIAASVCVIVIRVLLLFALYIVVKNFGRGLKYKVFQLPINHNVSPVLPRKRNVKKCCGIVCCGPIG